MTVRVRNVAVDQISSVVNAPNGNSKIRSSSINLFGPGGPMCGHCGRAVVGLAQGPHILIRQGVMHSLIEGGTKHTQRN